MTKHTTKQKGFTLIELMIVVAIIGILAAIAIPQFSTYRLKAFNGAAEADLRNLMTAQEAAYADTQSYATIATVEGFDDKPDNAIANLPGAKLSKGVTAIEVATPTATEYSMNTKHFNGDNLYNGRASAGIQSQTQAAGTTVATTAPTTP